MKRKMVIIGISYILGLFFASFFSQSGLWLLCIGAGCLLLWMRFMGCIPWKVVLVAMVSFGIGVSLYGSYTAFVYQPVVRLQGTETKFVGQVESAAVYDREFAVYVLDGIFQGGTEAAILCMTEDSGCQYGDYIEVSGTFSVPEKDYLYDSTRYYQGKSVFLQADADCTCTVLHTEGHWFVRTLADYREKIQRRIYAVAGKEGGSLTAAMFFGIRSGLDERVEHAFYHAGMGPMLAVSGFHLVLFSAVCGVIGRRTRLQRMLQFAWTVILVAVFVVIAQWPISVLRAGIMLLLTRSACIFFRKADALNSLCISVMVLTAFQPYLIHDVSFLLSVAGTFGVSVFAPYMTEPMHPCHWYGVLGKMVLSSGCVTLCTIPVCICYFSETSLLAPISNVVFLPMCMILMACAIIIFFCGGAPVIADLCGAVMDAVGKLLSDCLLWTESALPVSFPLGWNVLYPVALILCIMVFLIFLLLRSRTALSYVLTVCLVILSAGQWHAQRCFGQELHVYVLGRNAEQVLAITYAGRTDVVDLTGDRKNADYLQKFLTEHGISQIQTLYLTENIPAMASVYEKALDCVEVEMVIAGTNSFFRSQDTLCGQTVQISDTCRIETEQYSLTVSDGQLLLSAYGKTLLAGFFSSLSVTEGAYDFIISGYEPQKQQIVWIPQNGTCGEILCAGQNLELIFYENGSIRTGRLE